MTVQELAEGLSLTALNVADSEREVCGGYAGDLLSWVMGRAQSGDAWVTIMSNMNVPAVAQLTDVACVIFAEGVTPASEVIAAAKLHELNLFTTKEDAFTVCGRIYEVLK